MAYIAINVAGNYGGTITGLFYTGSGTALPPQLAGSHTRRVQDPVGYDGQYYHLIAHDPLLTRGFSQYVDNPSLRWRRIGIPLLASVLSGGNDNFVDVVYVGLQLAFLFAGTFWLGAYVQRLGLRSAWGLLFLLVPAVLVSIDRMTIDLPLAALCVGLVHYAGKDTRRWRVYCILCVAPLVRETGMLPVVGWCAWSLVRRRWTEIMRGAACALPALSWWMYVHLRTSHDGTPWLSRYPFSGLIDRTLAWQTPASPTMWLKLTAITECLALAGVWIAVGCAIYLALRRRSGLIELTAILFMAFTSLLGKRDIWDSTYAAGRTLSPLLIMLALIGLRERQLVYGAPILLMLPRIALQYEAQLLAAARALL
jgi:hypothetical protein